MRPIPKKLRSELSQDPFYKQCCITGSKKNIQFHHNFIWAGRQINEKWCILPLTKSIHDMIWKREVKEQCDWIMLNRASGEELEKYGRITNLIHKRDYLNKKFGNSR